MTPKKIAEQENFVQGSVTMEPKSLSTTGTNQRGDLLSVHNELQLHSNHYFPFLKEYMCNKCALHRQDMSERITELIRA